MTHARERTEYIACVDEQDARDKCEAIGREHARSIGKPWPMPPDVIGPGKQPVPISRCYQRYLVAPEPADASRSLPIRIELTAEVEAMQGAVVRIGDGREVTIDVSGKQTLPTRATERIGAR